MPAPSAILAQPTDEPHDRDIEALLADLDDMSWWDALTPAQKAEKNREAAAKVSANSEALNQSQAGAAQGFVCGSLVPSPLAALQARLGILPKAPATASSTSNVQRLHTPANANDPRFAKNWDRTDEQTKLDLIGLAAEEAGATVFRCTFSQKRENRLHGAAALGQDIVQSVASEIMRKAKKQGIQISGLVFGLEQAPVTNKLHAHGWFIAERSPAADQLLRDAFCAAFGKISGKAGGSQFRLEDRPLYDAPRFLSYFQKSAKTDRRDLGVERLVYVSRSARQLGRDYHASRSGKPVRAPARKTITTTARPTVRPVSTTIPAKPAQRLTSAREFFRAPSAIRTHNARPGASVSQRRPVQPRSTSPPAVSTSRSAILT